MPRLARPVAITARASVPGSRKSIGRAIGTGSAPTDMKNASRTIGMTSVTSTLSPRRRLSNSSTFVWASTARQSGAGALGAVVAASATGPSRTGSALIVAPARWGADGRPGARHGCRGI